METITDFIKRYPYAVAGGILVVILIGWWLWTKRARVGQRLKGLTVKGGENGEPCESAAGCKKICGPVTGASGYAQWVVGKKCWCVGEPYMDPKWEPDPQWTSGLM